MIELRDNQLVLRFPEVHQDAVCRIEFQRTLRIPDDNREYRLPPGLGRFTLHHVDDYASGVPQTWLVHGGVFLPMYQAEAMWINFSGRYPFAIKVAAGKINAVTGDRWTDGLTADPQDYLVRPEQPWLDGFCVAKGQIRQFVAMRLGEGYTAEEQLAGEARHGGVQIVAYPMKAQVYEERLRAPEEAVVYEECPSAPTPSEIGLAPGGLMRQEIYEDPYGIDAWDPSVRARCFVHIVSSLAYLAITKTEPPIRPPTAREYTEAGLPWFDYYGADLVALKGAKQLAGLDSVAAKGIKQGQTPLPENDPVKAEHVTV